jgi:hypothetical protein
MRVRSALYLFVLLVGVYTLSYSGTFKTGDEQLFVSGAVSLGGWNELSASPVYADRAGLSYVEPLNAYLGAWLYRLAAWLGVGVVHTLFLTNIYVTALTAMVIFAIVCQQGYSLGIAAAVSVLFGIGTLVWPHSKLYFRDPLAMFFVALAWWSLERTFVRQDWQRQCLQWLVTLLLLGLGVLSKSTALFALPAFLLYAAVRGLLRPADRRTALLGLGGAFLGVALLALLPDSGPLARFALRSLLQDLSAIAALQSAWVWAQAISGMLLSPGKGLFWESPILLLAAVAWPLTDRRDRPKLLAPWLTLIALVLGTAYYRGNIWFGGAGWGVRHLLPAVPLLAVTCAPAIEALLRTRRRWAKAAGGMLILFSVLIQLGAVLLRPEAYYSWLEKIRPDAAWTLAIWHPFYIEALNYWCLLLAGQPLDLAWLRLLPENRLAVVGIVVAWIAVILLAAWRLWRMLRDSSVAQAGKRAPLAPLLALAALTILPYGLLRGYYPDPYYYAAREDFRAASQEVLAAGRPGDVIVLRGLSHPLWRFFVNYAYSPFPWYAYDPSSPIEEGKAEQREISESPSSQTQELFAQVLPGRYARMWLMNDQCAMDGNRLAEERWLAQRFFPVRAKVYSRECPVRVSLFAFSSGQRVQAQEAGLRFGEDLWLRRFEQLAYADRTVVQPGDIVPLLLEWEAMHSIANDYTISLQLLDREGKLCAQQDDQAVGGFLPMSAWPVEERVIDLRGLEIPQNLSPGEYDLLVVVYDWQTLARLPVRDASGTTTAAALLTSLTIAGP